MSRVHLNSAGGVIALLEDNNKLIKQYALQKLDEIVDQFWTEISEVVEKIEILYEDETFDDRNLAALISSKVYYHLGDYAVALNFALGAGEMFDVNTKTEYVDTILSQGIDLYTIHRRKIIDDRSKDHTIDPRLEVLVNRMFERCFEEGKFKLAVGMAIEARRIDLFEHAIQQSEDTKSMLGYCLKIALSHIDSREFRDKVLDIIVRLYQSLDNPDFVNICHCYVYLNDPKSVADNLARLIHDTSSEQILVAYQIAFDLYENASQNFLSRLVQILSVEFPTPAKALKELETAPEEDRGAEATAAPVKDSTTLMDTDDLIDGDQPNTSTETEVTSATDSVTTESDKSPVTLNPKLSRLYDILYGTVTIALHQDFLIRKNKTDLLVLRNIKEFVRMSITHNAAVIANAYMNYGTTSDAFLRDNLDWLGKASNWARYTATASLGLIHWGHEDQALKVMESYLPKEASSAGMYAEGGSLYALGLIHVNHGAQIIDYLFHKIQNSENDVLLHGGCLGIGLAAMGTARIDVYELLMANLQRAEADIGLAAAIGMGLVMLGSKDEKPIKEMIEYAQETDHDKILFGLGIGIALIVFGTMDDSESLIETLCSNKEPMIRLSGMLTIGMAYCGTGNNKAVAKLLHVAVSDVDDNIRRASVTCLGFLFCHQPEQCPNAVSLLADSYNPHVRCGAALALGIACAGTGNKEALALLKIMMNDSSNFVKQNAQIAAAMVLIQQTEARLPKVVNFRESFKKTLSDKHEDNLTKFGAIVATGILEAGGRNVTISLRSRSGQINAKAAVGLLIFVQYWFWFPFAHFLSLAFTPTAVIGINADLNLPDIKFISNAPPNLFAYPEPLKKEKEKEKGKVATAILSVTARNKPLKPEDKDEGDTKDAKPEEEEVKSKESGDQEAMEVDSALPEPTFEILSNPTRALPKQLPLLTLEKGCRYTLMKDLSEGGIILLHDSLSDEPEVLVEKLKVALPGQEESLPDLEAPEPFDWSDSFLD